VLAEIITETKLPLTVADRDSQLPINTVVADIIPAYRTIMPTLMRLGYECFVGCESGHDFYCSRQQLQFYAEVAASHPFQLIRNFNRISMTQGQKEVVEAVRSFAGRRVAIFAPSDQSARTILDFLAELDLKVPEFAGLVGYSGCRQATEYSPRLTSIQVKPELIGALAARFAISPPDRTDKHKIPLEFLFGETI